MLIEIDQSGRIEYTSVPTVIGDSNGNSILITAKDKQFIQNVYRNKNKPRNYVIELFSLLIIELIYQTFNTKINNIYLIDTEYLGKDNIIKAYMFRYIEKMKLPIEKNSIFFGHIGRHSKAHKSAYEHFKNPKKFPKRRVNLKKLLLFLT